jgi:LPS-assembly protein
LRLIRYGQLALACTAAATLTFPGPSERANAQAFIEEQIEAPGQRLLLEADQLVYDFDRETITATGDVKIYYGAYVLDAGQVVYDQQSGRLVATGGVRMLEPGGYLVTAERIDITDDFADAFIASLNVVTIDEARFTAQSAERRGGDLLIFRRGTYTACAPCRENPGKPPLWQIKAVRITHDRVSRTIYYEHARLEFLGIPIAYVPVFFHPDPTVERKTGFLTPSILEREAIGVGITTPFFWNLAPNYDVTFSPTVLTRQGLLLQTEWRHRLLTGGYSIRLSGIFQQDKDAFREDGEPLSGYRDLRGSAHSEGVFGISDDWVFGWDVHATSDRTFNRDYRIPGAAETDLLSTVYLSGQSDRNHFDLRGYHFLVQREDTEEDLPDDGDPTTPDVYIHDDQAEQALVHPVLDHNYILGRPVLGGELRLDSNLASLTREESDIRHPAPRFGPIYAGVAGTFTRATSRATWRRRLVVPGGQVVTPFAYLQADAHWLDGDDPASGVSSHELIGRAMPAVGIEYEWPFLATIGPTVHTFGPRVQVIARPNEERAGDLPNEDSQSLVFDDTNLFMFDKFAGYDRQEGGMRANLGLLYQGLFPGGASIDALVGQSFQLAGSNSFALRDHALTGIGSGLESDASDYLGRVTVNTGLGVSFTGRARFDDEDFTLNRTEVAAIGAYGDSVASLGYTYIRESPASGVFSRREEISAAAAVEVVDRWSVLGSLVYDRQNESVVTHSFGLAYADECLEISAIYSETPDAYSDLVAERQIFVRFTLRTLGETGFGTRIGDDAEAE